MSDHHGYLTTPCKVIITIRPFRQSQERCEPETLRVGTLARRLAYHGPLGPAAFDEASDSCRWTPDSNVAGTVLTGESHSTVMKIDWTGVTYSGSREWLLTLGYPGPGAEHWLSSAPRRGPRPILRRALKCTSGIRGTPPPK